MKTLEDLGYTLETADSNSQFYESYGMEVYFKGRNHGMFSIYILIDRKNDRAVKITGYNASQYFTLDELKAVTALLEENKHD